MNTQKFILPAVAAAIFNEKGEILLQRRKDLHKWCIPSGHVEFGESVEEAILREIYEEIGVTAEIRRLIGVYSSPASQTYTYGERVVQYVTSYFEVGLTNALPADYCNEEIYELRFFSPHRLPQNMALMNDNWLDDALAKDRVFMR